MTNNEAAALLDATLPLAREALLEAFHGNEHSEFTPPVLQILPDGRVHCSMTCLKCGDTKHTVIDTRGDEAHDEETDDVAG